MDELNGEPEGFREFLTVMVRSFSEVNSPDWLMEKIDMGGSHWDWLAVMDAMVRVLRDPEVGEVMKEHLGLIGMGIGVALIKEGYEPVVEIRQEWQEYFGLFGGDS